MLPAGQANQMSAMRWLEAGATGSFGTVIEPCNYLQKFPSPGLLIQQYLGGASLIESYWKSVAWPAEGLFIGEPLATPFSRRIVAFTGDKASLQPYALAKGSYRVEKARFPIGPYVDGGRELTVSEPQEEVRIEELDAPYVRLVRVEQTVPRS
jgi:hypothetical protein